MLLPQSYLERIKTEVLAYATIRRDVIKVSGDALHASKKAIFAMHRDDMEMAKDFLVTAETLLLSLVKQHKQTAKMKGEGAYKAALEEFVEATIFHQFLLGKKITKIKKIMIPDVVFLAGLADVPGELYRYSLKAGTAKDMVMIEKCQALASEIVESLIEFDLTKQLRSKFDQSKSALHKIERVVYELSLTV